MGCFIDYINELTCLSFPESNWLVVKSLNISDSKFLNFHEEFTLTITGITNPPDTDTVSGFKITYIENYREKEYSVYSDYGLIEPGNIQVTLTPDSYLANAVDVTYT